MALLRCSKIQVDKAYSRASLKDLILAHPDTKKRIEVFALSIYGLVAFPKALGTLMKQSLIYSTSLIRGLHQSWRFW
ncbi:hypothetical protein Gotri_026259 [Gossypium trilobum]|uniref:Uncharacterized protein n=1 Tax=Gossypium trilobum TaxID=34281 RepID=A0A7J9FV32_9ROSI|nr:hypothetical protein [Gossypium trilobum]